MAIMAVTLLAAPTSVPAVQLLDADGGEELVAKISRDDPNRIRIAGEFITMAVGPEDGRIAIEKDEKQGQIFVRMNTAQGIDREKAFTLFLTDSKGRGYTMLMKPEAITGQAIVVRQRTAGRIDAKRPVGISARESSMKVLVRAAAMDNVPRRCEIVEEAREVTLWEGASMRLDRSLHCAEFTVERYTLTNSSDKPSWMAEQELYEPGVAGVAVERLFLNPAGVISLDPGQSTMVIIVRNASHG